MVRTVVRRGENGGDRSAACLAYLRHHRRRALRGYCRRDADGSFAREPVEWSDGHAAAKASQAVSLADSGECSACQHDPRSLPDDLERILARSQDSEAKLRVSTEATASQAGIPALGRARPGGGGRDLDWAATDGFASHNDCPYFPPALPGAWEPTPPLFAPEPAQPCWGMLRPMVLISGEECPAPGHPAFSTETSSDFYASALEVYETGLSLTDEQKAIADYWSDGAGATGTPPGHWIAIVSQIAREDDLSLATAAEAYARVGIAVHDAFIACWSAKYMYNLQRPVSYINEHIDADWLPYIATPSFPSYTSGHATVSGAAARPHRSIRNQALHGHDTRRPPPGAAAEAAHIRLVRSGRGRGGDVPTLWRHPFLVRQSRRARFRALRR